MSNPRYASVYLAGLVLAVGLANLLWTAHVVNTSQRQWCATLTLLTARPVPKPSDPAANPSRENAYIFYSNLVQLRQRFGCGGEH